MKLRVVSLLVGWFVALSPARGEALLSFGPTRVLNSTAATDGEADNERVSVAGDGIGNWVANWSGAAAHSVDNGVTWSLPVITNAGFAPKIATDGAGTWITVSAFFGDVFVSRSVDNGATWSTAMLMPDGSRPDIATDRAGTWIITWTSNDDLGGTIDTDPDILMVRSTDNGLTWSPPVPLNPDAAVDGNTFDNDARIATDGAGRWVAIWLLGSRCRH